ELELGNTKSQQTTYLRVSIKNYRFNAIAHQDISAAEARWPRPDDRHFFISPHHFGHVRAPAHRKRGIRNVFLGAADGNRPKTIVEGTGALTQPILRTNPPADLRQRVGLMTQLRRFEDIPFRNELEPIGDKIVYRALPFAVRVATFETAV